MSEIIKLMTKLAPNEGFNQSLLKDIRIFKASQPTKTYSFHYDQGLIFVAQGAERISYKDKVYEYNQQNYLVLTVPISANCEVIINANKPLLAAVVDINISLLNSIVARLNTKDYKMLHKPAEVKGLFLSSRHKLIDDNIVRLLRALQSPIESNVIGTLLLRELIFRVLIGENGHLLIDLTEKNSQLAKIDKILKYLHTEYATPVNVDILASMANMSASTFYRLFKELTGKSPIQYLKSIRIKKARDLLTLHGQSVSSAAHQVGYQSTAQFSREFKRAYGKPPKNIR